MFRPKTMRCSLCSSGVLFAALLTACASGGSSGIGVPPANAGTHTVMGRSFFPGGVMVLIDAHLQDGRGYGTVEYSEVQSRGENALRLFVDVECVGLFGEGAEAVVTGPISRSYGDQVTEINAGDWWVVHVMEGGSDGDLLSAFVADRARALSICQVGPEGSANLRAVDGDLSIH
jgi:hypothetical protein